MSCILGACIVAAQLTHGGTYTEETSTEVTFINTEDTSEVVTYKTQDISSMYNITNTQFKLGGYVVLDTDTRINLDYDNGLESQKRSRGKALTVGITQLSVINKDSHITYGISTKLGGKVKNVKCLDKQNVNYFCETAQLWSTRNKPKNDRDYKVSVNYKYNFNWFLGTK